MEWNQQREVANKNAADLKAYPISKDHDTSKKLAISAASTS